MKNVVYIIEKELKDAADAVARHRHEYKFSQSPVDLERWRNSEARLTHAQMAEKELAAHFGKINRGVTDWANTDNEIPFGSTASVSCEMRDADTPPAVEESTLIGGGSIKVWRVTNDDGSEHWEAVAKQGEHSGRAVEKDRHLARQEAYKFLLAKRDMLAEEKSEDVEVEVPKWVGDRLKKEKSEAPYTSFNHMIDSRLTSLEDRVEELSTHDEQTLLVTNLFAKCRSSLIVAGVKPSDIDAKEVAAHRAGDTANQAFDRILNLIAQVGKKKPAKKK